MSFPLPLQTALISAGTAAAVALLLDLLVRPYLESRKDWVVSSASEKRKLIIDLRQLYSFLVTSHVSGVAS